MTRYVPQWIQAGSYAASLDRRLMGGLWPSPASLGCAVTPAGTGMDVHVAPGQVAVPAANNTGSVLCTSDGIETISLAPAPPAGTDRRDLIVCRPRSIDLDGVSTQEDFIFEAIAGAEGAPPGITPSTPAGTVALAYVHVPGGVATVVAGNIGDLRPSGLRVPSKVNRLYGGRWDLNVPLPTVYSNWASPYVVPLPRGGKIALTAHCMIYHVPSGYWQDYVAGVGLQRASDGTVLGAPQFQATDPGGGPGILIFFHMGISGFFDNLPPDTYTLCVGGNRGAGTTSTHTMTSVYFGATTEEPNE